MVTTQLEARRSIRPLLRSWHTGRNGFDHPAMNRVGATQSWADAGDPVIAPLPSDRRIPVGSGSSCAQPVGAADDAGATAAWWWLGVHGGAAVSTLHRWIPGGADAHRRWPDPALGGPPVVMLVCRTHAAGLARARDAARQWAAEDVPAGLRLGGAVVVADARGRLSRPQSEALRLLSGVVPQLWRIPWIEEMRAIAAPSALDRLVPPPTVQALAADLASLRTAEAGRLPAASAQAAGARAGE